MRHENLEIWFHEADLELRLGAIARCTTCLDLAGGTSKERAIMVLNDLSPECLGIPQGVKRRLLNRDVMSRYYRKVEVIPNVVR